MRKKVNIYKNKISKVEGKVKKVSVIIPNYNYEKYIVERIDSILRQSYPIYELIILDDKSTDNSINVIKKKIKQIKNIPVKFIINDHNSGCVFSQWKKGLEKVNGDYFWIAEADDLCEPTFLETVMKGFENKNVVLSYCESARIDEKNRVITNDSRDLSDIFRTGDWDEDFVISGETAIKERLAYTNTILNVSSVVWKKKDYNEILLNAQEYKVAGDWYVYYKVLQNGSLAYFHESLNYYRKHSKSVTTNIKADIEFNEILKIQTEINNNYIPTDEILHKQKIRLNFMKNIISKKNREILGNFKRNKIAIVLPYPVKGSGGHRTIIQNANALIHYGYEVDIYVDEDFVSTNEDMKKMIEDFYGQCLAGVYVGLRLRYDYDLVFATAWTTAETVRNMPVKNKCYFIQDFEPWFEPMGNSYIKAENSYKYGFNFITIGRWLSNKLSHEYHQPTRYFNFCADTNNYKVLKDVKKEDAICFIYQPEKWRRCAELGLNAIKIVKEKYPNLKIYLFGSNVEGGISFDTTNLHIIPITECCKLYNKCKVGVCISASNPSRIPFEMMACGLPVVDLYRENNLYDMPDGGILLAESNSEAIATAILKIYENEKLMKKMSEFGAKYMKNYDLTVGFKQFVEAVNAILAGNYDMKEEIKPLYHLEPITPSKEYEFVPDENIPAFYMSNTSKFVKRMVRLKRKLRALKYKIFRR